MQALYAFGAWLQQFFKSVKIKIILNMKHSYLHVFIFIFTLYSTHAQDVNGTWKGFLYQHSTAKEETGFGSAWRMGKHKGEDGFYPLEVSIKVKGDSIAGTYQITADYDSTLSALFLLTGTWAEKQKRVSYLADIRRNGIGAFCFNKAKLNYLEKEGIQYLEGLWEGWTSGPCESGIMALWKPINIENNLEKEPSREIQVVERIQAKDSMLLIEIWDKGIQDGDSIILKFNNKVILSSHLVTKEKYTLQLPLLMGENLLEMVAINIGKWPPNTAAFRFLDGNQEQTVVLKSDMGKSQAIVIRRMKK